MPGALSLILAPDAACGAGGGTVGEIDHICTPGGDGQLCWGIASPLRTHPLPNASMLHDGDRAQEAITVAAPLPPFRMQTGAIGKNSIAWTLKSVLCG